jgi:hypothetical protein
LSSTTNDQQQPRVGTPPAKIGLPTYVERAAWGRHWDGPAALLSHTYVAAVERAGGVPILLPPNGLAGAAAAVVGAGAAAILPLVGVPAALALGAGVGLGTRAGVRDIQTRSD